MLQYLTYRIVKFWTTCNHCAGLRQNSRAAEILYIWSVSLQSALERNWSSTWRQQLGELRDALGGHFGEKFHMSPPAKFDLAGGSRQGAYSNKWITEMD